MKTKPNPQATTEQFRQPNTLDPCIGRIAGLDDCGRILVDYGQGRCNPARLVAGLNRFELSTSANKEREVLLNFANGDADRPIIVALMADPLDDLVCLTPDQAQAQDLKVDDETVLIEAHKEIVLKCGQSSILMRKDGKIVLKGIEIVSRAKAANKVKGASVHIN